MSASPGRWSGSWPTAENENRLRRHVRNHRHCVSVLRAGYLRGADLWHVACALYMAKESEDVTFITLDQRQAEVAAALNFRLDEVRDAAG